MVTEERFRMLIDKIIKIESQQLTHEFNPQVWKYMCGRLDRIEEIIMNGLSIEAYVKLNERVLELEEYIKNYEKSMDLKC